MDRSRTASAALVLAMVAGAVAFTRSGVVAYYQPREPQPPIYHHGQPPAEPAAYYRDRPLGPVYNDVAMRPQPPAAASCLYPIWYNGRPLVIVPQPTSETKTPALADCDGSPHLRPYVRKCCPWGQVFNGGNVCSDVDVNKTPRLQVPMIANGSKVISYKTDVFPILDQRLVCKNDAFKLDPSENPDESFKITESGELVSLLDEKNSAKPDHYCIEQFESQKYYVAAILCEREQLLS